jgi:hypothetical protein
MARSLPVPAVTVDHDLRPSRRNLRRGAILDRDSRLPVRQREV